MASEGSYRRGILGPSRYSRGWAQLHIDWRYHRVYQVSMRCSMSLCFCKYTLDPTHVVDWGEIVVDTYGTFDEGPMCILDSWDQVLQCKTMQLVKAL